MSQFQPLKIEPGSQMKPKSKMLMQLKDETVSEIVDKQPTPTNSRLNHQGKRLSSLMQQNQIMIDEGD